jgi:hypothetical protein
MEDLLIYGGATACFALGFFVGAATRLKAIKAAQDEADHAFQAYTKIHKDMVRAAKDCNAMEERLWDEMASNKRLTDALAAKNARLERIYEKGIVSKSGAAVHLAKIAEGLA